MSLLRPTSSIYLSIIRIGRTFSTSVHSVLLFICTLHLGSHHLGNRFFPLNIEVHWKSRLITQLMEVMGTKYC